MNNNINNVSFGANLVTTMRGRNCIMKDVAEKFATRTKGLNGTLELKRGGAEYPKALIMTLKEAKNTYVITNYGDLTGAFLKYKTQEAANQIADSLVKIFRVLRTENAYEKFVSKIHRSKSRTQTALDANRRSLVKVEDPRFENMYKALINQNRQKLDLLDSHLKSSKNKYLNMLNNIAGENPRAKQCVEILTTI